MSKLTFLEADRPLVKSFSRDAEGNLVKSSYPNAYEFTSHDFEVNTITQFHEALVLAASRGWCLLKGNTTRPLVRERRAGSTQPETLTWWVCLDIDRLPPDRSLASVVMSLGLDGYSHIVQYSASCGIEPERGETGHIFIMLDVPQLPSVLKKWLVSMNFVYPFQSLIRLAGSQNALSYGLDVTTCQNDKLLYIAPPILSDDVAPAAIPDPRIKLNIRDLHTLKSNFHLSSRSVANAEQMVIQNIHSLRAHMGFARRHPIMRLDKKYDVEIMTNPVCTEVTGVKNERGFTYLNLGGGDSWGYYHPEDDATIIRNFKGEPCYLADDLIPGYFIQWTEHHRALEATAAQMKEAATSMAPTVASAASYLTVTDRASGRYWKVTYRPDVNEVILDPATSIKQLQDFRLQHDLPKAEIFEDWTFKHDPNDPIRISVENKTINTFRPSPYMTQVTAGREYKPWPLIQRILDHAVGRNAELQDHFLNWCAVILQHRCSTGTSWALHGVQGTGKGVLVNRILLPLFGTGNVTIKRQAEIREQFNDFVEHNLLCVVDEAEINDTERSRLLIASLKNFITEPTITIRKLYQSAYSTMNYGNWLFLSNKSEPVHIEVTDRRFNVGEYGDTPVPITPEEYAAVDDELEAFAHYLLTRSADQKQARRVLITETRANMIEAGTTSVDQVALHLLKGNLDYFIEQLPAGEAAPSMRQQLLHDSYCAILRAAMDRGEHKITRDEIRVLMDFCVGDMPQTPAKFTRMMKLHKVNIRPITYHGRTVRGMILNWVKGDAAWIRSNMEVLSGKAPGPRLVPPAKKEPESAAS
jgi:hypothetical protein